MSALIDNSSNNDDESDEDKSMDVFEQFLKYRKKKASRKKCTNSLVHEATRLIEEVQRKNGGEPKKRSMRKPLLNHSWEEPLVSKETPLQMPPPPRRKRKKNPLKKELSNPQGLDFANQAGALMAQPQKVEMLPPKDIAKESTRPEKAMSGVKNESKKVLRTKANMFDPTMQGRRSFTFKYEGTYRNPGFYEAKVVYSVKMINAPRVPTIGNTGYQMYQTTDGDGAGADVPSKYGPIIDPNNFADLFFEKAVIEVLGATEIEPSTQTHQTTKITQVYTTVKPEEAVYKYQNLGGYEEKYDPTATTQ